MFIHTLPAFRIYRLDNPLVSQAQPDAPAAHYRAFWVTGGRTLRVHVWSLVQWLGIPEHQRPPGAVPLKGPGFMLVDPVPRP